MRELAKIIILIGVICWTPVLFGEDYYCPEHIIDDAYLEPAVRAWSVFLHKNVGEQKLASGYPATTSDSRTMVVYVEDVVTEKSGGTPVLYYHSNLRSGEVDGLMAKLKSSKTDLRDIVASLVRAPGSDSLPWSELEKIDVEEVVEVIESARFIFSPSAISIPGFVSLVAPLNRYGVVRFEGSIDYVAISKYQFEEGQRVENLLWFNRSKLDKVHKEIEGNDPCFTTEGRAKRIGGEPICTTSLE